MPRHPLFASRAQPDVRWVWQLAHGFGILLFVSHRWRDERECVAAHVDVGNRQSNCDVRKETRLSFYQPLRRVESVSIVNCWNTRRSAIATGRSCVAKWNSLQV